MPTMQRPTKITRLALGILCAAGALFGAEVDARADADSDAPVYAVQNRRFNLKNEFNLNFGVLPMNAYTKGLTLGGGYTYHFSQLWAWEIIQFTYSFGVDTNLKQELVENYMAMPTAIPQLNYYASSSAIFKPLYGKLALTNRWVVHVEAFFAAGAGVGVYINPQVVRAGFDVGGGLRFHLNDLFSVRLDIRDLTYFKAGGATDSELYLGIGIAITLGRGAVAGTPLTTGGGAK